MANYTLATFLAQPTDDDTRIKIFDKNKVLKYSIDPNPAFFFTKSNIIVIKMEDKNVIYIDFDSINDANQAIVKLNDAKKYLIQLAKMSQTNGTVVFSKLNLNMNAMRTFIDGDRCCNTPINNHPKVGSFVKVFVNGLEVNVGGKVTPYDCYFSSDNGLTARIIGDEKYGDYLYWNTSIAGYNLDVTDFIDFEYLIDVN
jgi:hypothetical protein